MASLEKLPEEAVIQPTTLTEEDSNNDSTTFSHAPSGPPATRRELWAYYAYFAGNNGIGSFQ
jgi:hypothetical protein